MSEFTFKDNKKEEKTELLSFEQIQNVPGVYKTNRFPDSRFIIFPSRQMPSKYKDKNRARLFIHFGQIDSLQSDPICWDNCKFTKLSSDVNISLT